VADELEILVQTTENLHKYRLQKVSPGQRRIRKTRYPYQPKDVITYNGQPYVVKGIQNKGAYIKLAGLDKPVKTSLITPKLYRKGLCVA